VTTARLAQAIAAVVETKLAAGIAFLRVPEIVSPFPLAGMLDALHEVQDTRYAVFLEQVDVLPDPKLTLQVHEAILWRNDQRMTDNLVVIGDLERDRAAGLSSLPAVTAREVRQRLIRTLTYLARRTAANAKTLKIIDALKNERLNLDLQSLADYCDHLEPHLGTNDLQEACAGFWYLKLLPDRVSADVDIKRLRDNQARVTELRQADATSVQRLIGALSATGSGNYESLRMFASTGRREHLRNLEFDAVREAVKATTGPEVEEDDNAGADTPGQAERTDFLGAVRKDAIPEDDFLDQIRADREDDGAGGRINAGGAKIDWDSVPDGQLGPLMEQDGDVLPYAVAAGSLEHMPADEADPLPGRGKVEWGDLRDVVKELKVLEEVADVVPHPRPSSILEAILARRLELADWVTDIPREGLRLFLGAPTVADTARDLVNMWVSLWRSLDDLRGALDDEVGELIALGNRLAVTDTRIVEQGTAITAYLLPLHPMVLEPRVRAALMFREHPELDQDFFQIIQSALDPAVPSIKLPVGDTSFDLAYSGQFRGLPQYVRRSTQFHSADVVRAIQDSIDRFVNVHPYSKLSLRVALVDPTAETAKQMLKWLANVDPSRRERVALDVYAINESPGEIQSKLAEGREDLVSAEVSSTRFDYTLKPLNKLEELPAALRQSDRSPHVLCLFDPAVVRNTPVPVASLTPVLGALVNEWEFGARAKKEATPYIRPKTGSTALNDFLTAQSRLLGNDTHSATERNPLLQDDVLAVLDKVSAETSWVVVAQGASALVAPPNIGEAELLGRTSSGSHTAYVYSRTPALVLEPVLTYLQQYQYIQSDPRLIMRFVLQTIRLALPEGLLGFYKRLGTLSKESVLGRLGLAAVVAYLQQDDEHDADLIVSLDTEGARRWLGLRDGVNKRADLVRLAFGPEGCAVEAIEIKARTGSLVWGASTPDVVVEATEQVEAMYALVQAIFSDERDLLVASRREILKRQVFLEALHQWEPTRERDPDTYRRQIADLNRLFAAPGPDRGAAPTISKRVFIATPGDDIRAAGGATIRRVGDVDVTQLGLQWFRTLLSDQPGTGIEIDAALLDLLAPEDVLAPEPTTIVLNNLDEPGPPDDPSQPAATLPTEARETSAAGEDVEGLLQKLQQSFKARGVPYLSIGVESVEVGPSVVRVPVRLELGARAAQLESQSDDIARDLGVQSFRTSNLSGQPGYVVAEVPRTTRDIPNVETLTRPDLPYPAIAVGAGIDFTPYWQCLDDIPHLLVAGKTGSGKSVLIRSLLWQLTRLYRPSELELVLIGPKAADFMDFADAPHFRSPFDVHLRADGAIDLLREIVEVRYAERQATFDEYAHKAMREGNRVSNLRELMRYAEARGEQPPLRPFVVIVDEFVELLDSSPSRRKEFEALIARFSRLFRYIGGSMIVATQRPSVKSITGDIKANFRPLALRVERSVDSRVILDANGAEHLVGMGDCLYKADEGMLRLQGYAALGTYLSQ